MMMKDATRKDKIELTSPEFTLLINEQREIHEYETKLGTMVRALEDAAPDTAIAMWQRCQHMVRESKKTCQKYLQYLAQINEHVAEIDPYNLDLIIDKPGATRTALAAVGTYLGNVVILNTYEIARIEHVKPTSIMTSHMKQLASLKAQIREKLSAMITATVKAHNKGLGQETTGQYTLLYGEKADDPIYAVRRNDQD